MKKADDEPTLRGHDPKRTFYMAVSVYNSDGSLDVREGIEEICETEDDAVKAANGVNEEYADLECYVYRCIPVARVWRGKTKVTKLSEPSP